MDFHYENSKEIHTQRENWKEIEETLKASKAYIDSSKKMRNSEKYKLSSS